MTKGFELSDLITFNKHQVKLIVRIVVVHFSKHKKLNAKRVLFKF